METFEYRKSRTCEMKEDKYVKSLAKNQVYAYARYSEKRFTEMYIALYGDAMFVSPLRASALRKLKNSYRLVAMK